MGLTRDIDPALLAAMSSPVWHPIMLVDLDWPAGRLRMHSGLGWIEHDGAQWAGVGRFGQVSAPGEGAGLAASPVVLTLFGLPDDVLEMASSPIRDRDGDIWIGATTTAGGADLIGTPYRIITGYMDALRYTLRRDGGALEHGLQVDVGVGPSARAAATVLHSAEDQAAKYPGDTAGRHLINVQSRVETMTWPE